MRLEGERKRPTKKEGHYHWARDRDTKHVEDNPFPKGKTSKGGCKELTWRGT